MKRLCKTISKISMLLVLFAVFLSLPVQAQEPFGKIQIEQTDTDTKKPVSGIRLALYKIAEADENGRYQLTEDFKDTDLDPEHLYDEKNYQNNIKTLDQYIEKKQCSSQSSKVTGTDGMVSYENLSDGIYFIKQENTAEDFEKLGYSYETDSYMVVLPWTDKDGSSTRTVTCRPKGKLVYPEDTEDLIVYKAWKDDNNKAGKRPENISVGLYRNGTLQEKITLSAKNNWTYQWKNLSKKENWKIEELDVPAGYTSKITTEGSTYTITNEWTPNIPPKTGDSTEILIYFVMLAGAAAIFILCRKKA